MKYLYCHPFFDERKTAYRFSYQLHCAFENAGKVMERFDYHGTGESEGEFENVTLDTLRRDILKYLQKSPYCLIGTRFGATLALDCMLRIPHNVKMLVLINPVLSGTDYIDYVYRQQHIKNLLTGNERDVPENASVNIEGFKTSCMLIEQIKSELLYDLNDAVERHVPICYINSSNNEKMSADSKRKYDVLKRKCSRMVIHQLEMPPFWRRIPEYDYTELIKIVLDYCNGDSLF